MIALKKKQQVQALIQQNQFIEARKLCRIICKKHPQDPECWFLLGSILGQLNETQEAINCLKRCIKIESNIPIAYYNLGLIYQSQNKFTEAKACFRKIIKIDPGNGQAHYALATVLQLDARPEEALDSFQEALKLLPQSEAILLGISAAYTSCQQLPRAISTLKEALKLNPSNLNTYLALGNLYSQSGDDESAINIYNSALQINPKQVEILTNLGNIFLRKNAFQEATEYFTKALEINNNSSILLFNLGNTYQKALKPELAEKHYQEALKIEPDMIAALNNLGIISLEAGQVKMAIEYFIRSISAQDVQIDAFINLANCYKDLRQFPQAITTLQHALSISPDNPLLHGDLSLLLLTTKSYKDGWIEYEWRRHNANLIFRDFPFPEWTHEDISEKTILVTAEQGIGDEIMFASCINDLIQTAKKTIIECEPRLFPLYQRSFPTAIIQPAKQTDTLAWLSKVPTPDYWVSIGSLPLKFRNREIDFPERNKYLFADKKKTDQWIMKFSEFSKKLRIGISWKGGHISQAKGRSTELIEWKTILETPEIFIVNLQYGDTKDEIKGITNSSTATLYSWDTPDPLVDMDGFAAQISALDLVITVDNSTAHLAAALGIETWILQPFSADWRWATPSRSSLWYPQVQQFFQPSTNDWESVLNEVYMKLKSLLQHDIDTTDKS